MRIKPWLFRSSEFAANKHPTYRDTSLEGSSFQWITNLGHQVNYLGCTKVKSNSTLLDYTRLHKAFAPLAASKEEKIAVTPKVLGMVIK